MTQPAPATTSGGNTTLVNGDEKVTLDAVVTGVPVQTVGFQADDSHVTPQFRKPSTGGVQ